MQYLLSYKQRAVCPRIAFAVTGILFASFVLQSHPGWAQTLNVETDAERYKSCIRLSQTNAARSFDDAVAWRDLGGGDAAEHCAAVSLIELGHYRAAAERLEALASEPTDSAARRSGLLAQAAQAWVLDNQPERAFVTLVAAIGISPEQASLYLDRGAVLAEMSLYEEAIENFDKAIELDPAPVDAYLFRASANRYLENYDLALRDLERILDFAPTHLDALLERGIVRRLKGDNDGARKDWMWVLELGPDTAPAAYAQRNLELMDVSIEE